MRILLLVLLFLSFAYSLALVLANNTEVGVNLLFSQAPTMNLGLLLILCLILGIVIGIMGTPHPVAGVADADKWELVIKGWLSLFL